MQLITKIRHIQEANAKFVSDCDFNKTDLIDRKFIIISHFSQVCKDMLTKYHPKFKEFEHYHQEITYILLPMSRKQNLNPHSVGIF